jgi:hypothetical protein
VRPLLPSVHDTGRGTRPRAALLVVDARRSRRQRRPAEAAVHQSLCECGGGYDRTYGADVSRHRGARTEEVAARRGRRGGAGYGRTYSKARQAAVVHDGRAACERCRCDGRPPFRAVLPLLVVASALTARDAAGAAACVSVCAARPKLADERRGLSLPSLSAGPGSALGPGGDDGGALGPNIRFKAFETTHASTPPRAPGTATSGGPPRSALKKSRDGGTAGGAVGSTADRERKEKEREGDAGTSAGAPVTPLRHRDGGGGGGGGAGAAVAPKSLDEAVAAEQRDKTATPLSARSCGSEVSVVCGGGEGRGLPCDRLRGLASNTLR